MNHNDTVSIIAKVDLTAHALVKVVNDSGVAKVDLAGATDIAIGTVLQDVLAGQAASVFCAKGGGFHFVRAGTATAIAIGDEVDGAASGKVVKAAGGTKRGQALEPSSATDTVFRVSLYAP